MRSSVSYGASRDGQVDFVTGARPWSGAFRFYLTAGIASDEASVASVPVLYNPAVPTVVGTVWAPLVILRVMAVHVGVVSGTVIAGCILYGLGSGITFSSTATTDAASVNTFVGRGAETPAKFYTTATASEAPTVLVPSGLSAGGHLTDGALFNLTDKIGGSIVIPPGGSFWPFIGNTALAPALTALVAVDVIQTPMYDKY
jgi:hypothetical protein